ncbi:hypothetical protein [Magnetospirillum sp. 15-1]|uniref:hypothetical protein n=1 Tax=Magnetospirillum sp. 15-1 TaxID=1979370 RepID=UPI000BBBA544|nr:hypothetical protein [Magnetospirillum sp. 15-1]
MTLKSLTLAILLLATPALAQPMAIDRNYEAEKAAEISTAKLQLATQPGSTAVQELNEAESTLRRLKDTKAADQRRKIAAELEMAITRLKIAAGAGR